MRKSDTQWIYTLLTEANTLLYYAYDSVKQRHWFTQDLWQAEVYLQYY